MDLEKSADDVTDVLDELIEQYESLLEKDELDFMAKQDADMKVTALKSVQRDVKRYAE